MTFKNFNLKPALLDNLESLNYTEATPIQVLSLPAMLAGEDVVAQGKTGSGKTAAFGLVLLQKIKVKLFMPQSLVLCPTRELANQVADEIRKLARTTHNIKVSSICGGSPFFKQVNSLEKGAHIIVGTPGRILDHLQKDTLNLKELSTLVLDEADRMMDMGFAKSLDEILTYLPRRRQNLLFSATFPEEIKKIATEKMHNPKILHAQETHDKATIKQGFYKVDDNEHRLEVLQSLLIKYPMESTLVFSNTIVETKKITKELRQNGFSALALHGDLDQKDRDQSLIRFSNKSVAILVATDVAARGLDIEDLGLIVNYQPAQDSQIHTHRIGRTGRAGATGLAHTLFSGKQSYRINQFDLGLEEAGDNISQLQQPLPQVITNQQSYRPKYSTIRIDGGKKQKLRAGDIVGALTNGDDKITGKHLGKINIVENWSFVAIETIFYRDAIAKIHQHKIKGRSFRAKRIT